MCFSSDDVEVSDVHIIDTKMLTNYELSSSTSSEYEKAPSAVGGGFG
jgi:hypothetical protein